MEGQVEESTTRTHQSARGLHSYDQGIANSTQPRKTSKPTNCQSGSYIFYLHSSARKVVFY